MDYQRKCFCCGVDFIAHDKRKIYCSPKCKDVAYKRSNGQDSRLAPRDVECGICGKRFQTFNVTKSTCSEECSRELRRQRKGHSQTWSEYVAKVAEEKKQRDEIKAIENQWYKLAHTVERECKYCGSLFYCADTSQKKCCSSECSKKIKYQKKDKRIPKDQIVDTDITLPKLYRRDGGVCWMCGRICDWNDRDMTDRGAVRYGNTYPNIDHLVPVSRGGLHSWDNVRLACAECNGKKSDSIVGFIPLDHQAAYALKRKGNPAKKTIQMTLTGDVVKIWNSTYEVNRVLGYNDSHIRDACAGKRKTAYGFKWQYA